MTTQAELSLKGLEEYLEKIVQAGQDIDEAAARAVLAGGEVLQEGMQSRVAVLSGNLHDHIRVVGPEQDGDFIYVEVGVIHSQGFTDDDTARYGNAQEYGTSTMPAHPYIRPTMDEDGRRARAAMRESLARDGKI